MVMKCDPSPLWGGSAERRTMRSIVRERGPGGGSTREASLWAYPYPTGPNKNLGQPPSPQGGGIRKRCGAARFISDRPALAGAGGFEPPHGGTLGVAWAQPVGCPEIPTSLMIYS